MMHTTKLGHPSRFISSLSWLFPSRMGTIKNSIWSKEHVIRGIEKMCKSEILLPLERTLDIYEFGVYRGETTVLIEHLLYGYQFTYKNLWGFDAFEGLPQEAPGLINFSITQKVFLGKKTNPFINLDRMGLIFVGGSLI